MAFHLVRGARHNANQDAPEETNRIIRESVQQR